MVLFRHFLRAAVLLTACLLVSCLDGHEEFWLNDDGSGRADIRYSFPASAAKWQGGEAGVRKKLDELLGETKEIQSSAHEVTVTGDRMEVHVQASFASVDDLGGLENLTNGEAVSHLPPAIKYLAGEFQIKAGHRDVDFARIISPGKALAGSAFMPQAQFQGRSLTYILHLPCNADTTNATRVEDGGRTLVWEVPLAQAIRKPIEARFHATIPIPPMWITIAVGVVVTFVSTVISIAFKYWRQRTVKG